MPDAVRIGLLGSGTVGGSFRELVGERAAAIEAATGRRPEIAGVLTSSDGDFEKILEDSEVVVELIGGTDPAHDYVLRALRAGRHVVTANKQLIARHGDEVLDAARQAGVQIRFEAAVAGVIPVIRVIQESLAATEIEKVFGIVNGTTNYVLTEMAKTGASYDEALARAQELGYAEADPSEDVNGADAAAKMAILARLAFHTPAAAGLGDVVASVRGDAPVHETRERLDVVTDVSSAFYLHLEVADRPGVLAAIASVLGEHEVSVKSVVQRGMGDDARLVMVMHECPEERFAAALDQIARLDFLRSPPRSIRVIEEEFS
jgi:homoserine dehydrogenase